MERGGQAPGVVLDLGSDTRRQGEGGFRVRELLEPADEAGHRVVTGASGRVRGEEALQLAFLLARKVPVEGTRDQEVEVARHKRTRLRVGAHDSSSTRAARPRAIRLLTVPIGTFSTRAMSS
ncbi:MAG: hypothetical protein IPP07_21245 [Holophagales bacterium]|nr:hypothetical protein [Holophagales bacterium]